METGKLEKLKQTAEFLKENNITAFVKDIYGTWYTGNIVLVGDIRLTLDNTEGKLKGIRSYLIWTNIDYLDEKKPKGVSKNATRN